MSEMSESELLMEEQRRRQYAHDLLNGCLKRGLAELCQEKPAEPVRWLAHWLLANNPNKPKVVMPAGKAPPIPTKQTISRDEIDAVFASRSGHTLSSHVTLVAETSGRSEYMAYPMPGAPGFLKAPQFSAGLVGQSSIEGCKHVIEAMQQGQGGVPEAVVWVSIRSEMVVYLQGEPYVLRALAHPDEPFDRHVDDGEELADLEDELKAEVEEEIRRQRGRLLVHDSSFQARWLSLEDGSVRTPHEAIPHATPPHQPFLYRPLPLPSSGPLSREEIVHVLSVLSPPSHGSSRAVVIASVYGCSCKPLVALTACMSERVGHAEEGAPLPRDTLPVEPLPLAHPKYNPPRRLLEDLPAVEALLQRLDPDAGPRAKLLADDTMDRCKFRPHLRESVLEAQAAANNNPADASAQEELRTRIRIYVQAVAIAGVLLAGEDQQDAVLEALEAAIHAA